MSPHDNSCSKCRVDNDRYSTVKSNLFKSYGITYPFIIAGTFRKSKESLVLVISTVERYGSCIEMRVEGGKIRICLIELNGLRGIEVSRIASRR